MPGRIPGCLVASHYVYLRRPVLSVGRQERYIMHMGIQLYTQQDRVSHGWLQLLLNAPVFINNH